MMTKKTTDSKKCPVCSKYHKERGKFCSSPCQKRSYNLKQRYKIDSAQVVEMYRLQSGKCAICDIDIDVHELGFTDKDKAAIDHNHFNGHIRGLLCHSCNVGLGHFKDSRVLLKNAIKYLTKRYKRS